jgi:hypothetical protein
MATYVEIASVTVGSGGAATINFASIPATYTDLMLVASVRSNRTPAAYDDIRVSFNNSSTATAKVLEGSGSSASSFSTSNYIGQADTAGNTSNTFSSVALYVPNYLSGSAKSYSADTVQEENGTTAYADLVAGLWNDTNAINRVEIYCAVGSFVQYSTAYLYGIKKD